MAICLGYQDINIQLQTLFFKATHATYESRSAYLM